MVKKHLNGNGKSTDPFKDKKIEFPVTFELKAVMVEEIDKGSNKQKLESVFDRQQVAGKFVSDKISSKGSYISYTYRVTLNSKKQLDQLYDDLKKVEGLKFAL